MTISNFKLRRVFPCVLPLQILAMLGSSGVWAATPAKLETFPPATSASAPVTIHAAAAIPASQSALDPVETPESAASAATGAPTVTPQLAKTVRSTDKPVPHKASKRTSAAPTPSLETVSESVLGSAERASVPGTERAVFERAPVKIVLEAQRERRIYFPFEAALQLPDQVDGLQAEIIGSTLYLTGTKARPALRAVVEGLEGQGRIPLDIVVREHAPSVPDELEILLPTKQAAGASPARRGDDSDDEDGEASPDLVQLSRYCVQMLYSPQRLIQTPAGVRSIDVRAVPIAGLYRGSAVLTTPIGAWRSAALYVTAVRFTNRASSPIDLDMERLRGHWLAATPVHYRLAPSGNEADTTAACLVSDQPFDAVRP